MYQIPELFKSPDIWVEGGVYIPGESLVGANVYYEELPIVLHSDGPWLLDNIHFIARPCLENK